MPFVSFHVAYVEIPSSFVAFLFEPFGKKLELLEEFHNMVKCQQKTLSIGGKANTTTSSGCTTNNPTSIWQNHYYKLL
jgi:hypothetical protein